MVQQNDHISSHTKIYDVAIIGGGLAGLCASIDLAQRGYQVIVIEKKSYPFHKVCGEYLSREVIAYLLSLDVDARQLGAKKITKFQLSSHGGDTAAKIDLPLGGLSISRYVLDHHLYKKAKLLGVKFALNTKVQSVCYEHDNFTIQGSKGEIFSSRTALGAFGKSNPLQAHSTNQTGTYTAFKNYYKSDFPDDTVAIHTFEGGYCGLSKVETGLVNMTYIVSNEVMASKKSPDHIADTVLSQNVHLAHFIATSEPLWPRPISVSNLNYHAQDVVQQHMLMLGDAASMIAPICGNGMAMAIHSAAIACTQVDRYLKKEISQSALERHYKNAWKELFSWRLRFSPLIQRAVTNGILNKPIIGLLSYWPDLLKKIVSQTHGSDLDHSYTLQSTLSS